MLKTLRFTKKWRCFEKGDSFDFKPGVNLLVGDQGCGKSSLLQTIKATGHTGKSDNAVLDCTVCMTRFFDFEKDNPRTLPHFKSGCTQSQIGMMFSSHGETNRALIKSLEDVEKGEVVMMDEPDAALSLRTCKLLVQTFVTAAERGIQIVASVHNPYVIKSFDKVYSLEKREWMTGVNFILDQLTCETCGCYPCGCGG